MADILINNMELPKERGLFLCICSNGTIQKQVGRTEDGYPIYNIVKDAMAIELPSHGRLIDADELSRNVPEAETSDFERCWCCTRMTKEEIKKFIEHAPTIVEASNGSDN